MKAKSRTEPDMTDRYVVDCDAHYMEPLEDIAEYMDEPWRTRLQQGGKSGKRSFFTKSSGDRFGYGKIERKHSSYPHESSKPEEIAEAMEFLGIDKQLVISNIILESAHVIADDDRTASFAKGYVRYATDNLVDVNKGIYTLAPIPYYDVDASLEILEMIEDEEGVVGACIVTGGANTPLGNRKYDPIYELGSDLGLPFVFHTGGSGLDEYVRAGYEKLLETHVLGFVESNMSQLTSLLVQGVPEKFPSLDIIFMESGITWVPALATRLDEEYMKRQQEAPLLEKLPSEYVKDIYFGTQPFEQSADAEYLEKTIEMVGGPGQLLYASDYPHWDYDRVTSITNLPFLSEENTRNILSGNAEEVFGL